MLFPLPSRPVPAPRVAVTGAGIITPLGLGWSSNSEGFRAGRQSARPVTLFDVSRQRSKMACEIDLPARLPKTKLASRQEKRLSRAGVMLIHAAHEAWTQSGWQSETGAVSLVLGTTSAGMQLGEAFYRTAIDESNRRNQPARVVHYQAQRQAIDLAEAFGFQGPATIIANACASGANAVGHGFELIRTGRAERVLVGGYDGLSHLVFSGFDSLKALSTTSCRPFDAARDGLMLGEGAAVLCLEPLAAAQLRGAMILGEIVGYGSATDIHHLTQPNPEGDAALESMSLACQDAGVDPGQIGYINAHGTGTPANDAAEARAIVHWAGADLSRLQVSSTKASIGHLLGAAGTVETTICLMALEGQWLPPEIGLDVLDPAVTFRIVQKPVDSPLEYALTNSFGFGGANASVLLRRAE